MGKTFNDAALIELHTTVTSINSELATPSAGPEALRALSKQLVEQLAIELPRPTRACPHCASPGMLDASRCGTCWAALVPEARA